LYVRVLHGYIFKLRSDFVVVVSVHQLKNFMFQFVIHLCECMQLAAAQLPCN